MEIAHPGFIWLVVPLLAVAFLLWVLWNLIKEDRKHRASARVVYPLHIHASAGENRQASGSPSWGVHRSGEASAHPLTHSRTR